MQTKPENCVSSIVGVQNLPYNCGHIRPLAVSPLNHPESEPTPWGFSFSAPREFLPGLLTNRERT